MKVDLTSSGGRQVALMGFDTLTDEEIMYVMDRSPSPELMGGKLRDWFKRRKKRAKAFFKKVKKKYRKLPKWAKIATGAALIGPLAVGAPIAAGVAISKARKRRKAMLAKMTPAQRAAYLKKRKKRLRIASMFIPGVAPIAATAMAVKGIRKGVKRRRKAKLARRRKSLMARRAALIAARRKALAAKQKKVAVMKQPARVTKKMVPVKAVQKAVPAEPAKKKGGLAPVLATAALALPLLLGQ